MKFCYSYFLVLLVMLLMIASLAIAQEVENERDFNYNESSHLGPAHWGEIHPEWSLCNNGTMQSPIDLLHERVQVVQNLGRLRRDYKPSNATLMNRGHDMMVRTILRWEGGGGNIYINGTPYQLGQCHWHSPSEHTINGKRFDLEIHLVHQRVDGKIAVIGALYQIGQQPDSFLSKMAHHIEALAHTTDLERVVGKINPLDIRIGTGRYYRYLGSLTVPPCTQNVTWTIVKKVQTVTRKQVRLIRQAVKDNSETNARPLQPINKRSVKLYMPRNRQEN